MPRRAFLAIPAALAAAAALAQLPGPPASPETTPTPPTAGDPSAAATVGHEAPPPPRAEVQRGAMISLPGGTFRAGERVGVLLDTVAYHRVRPFLMDATEVTVAEYGACVRAGRCTPAGAAVRWEGLGAAERARWSQACNAGRADRGDHPVNCVDWSQARAYCAFAGKRLPTEEEWEWAARGADAANTFPWGAGEPADRACWSGAGSGAAGPRTGTCPVGSHPRGAAPAGLQDLAGNVWEWTDTHDVILPDSRGRGGVPARIVRGGGFGDANPFSLTASRRAKDQPGDRAADLGFRCVQSR